MLSFLLIFPKGEYYLIIGSILAAVGTPFTLFLNILLYQTVDILVKNRTGIEDLIEHKEMEEYYQKENWRENVLEQIRVDPKIRWFEGWFWPLRFYFNPRR